MFWLEPAGYELCASRDPEPKLVVSYSEDAFRTLFHPVVLMERTIDPVATAAEILRCLRTAQPMFAAAEAVKPESWHRFPDAQVLELEQALA